MEKSYSSISTGYPVIDFTIKAGSFKRAIELMEKIGGYLDGNTKTFNEEQNIQVEEFELKGYTINEFVSVN